MTLETKDWEGAEPLTKPITTAVNYTSEIPNGRLRGPNKIAWGEKKPSLEAICQDLRARVN